MTERPRTREECELCKAGLHDQMESYNKAAVAAVASLRREIRVGISVSITVTTILLTVFELLTLKVI